MSVPITAEVFHHLIAALGSQGVKDVDWAESIVPPSTASDFAREVIFVVCHSGMKNTVADGIFRRCMAAIADGRDVREAFKHPGKSAAIAKVWEERQALFDGYCQSTDRLSYLAGLPWIGPVTKYHLAKGFGLDVAKPDVHLQRLADREGCSVQALCDRLASETGYRVATVDTILWRACANGVLDSRTGAIPSLAAA